MGQAASSQQAPASSSSLSAAAGPSQRTRNNRQSLLGRPISFIRQATALEATDAPIPASHWPSPSSIFVQSRRTQHSSSRSRSPSPPRPPRRSRLGHRTLTSPFPNFFSRRGGTVRRANGRSSTPTPGLTRARSLSQHAAEEGLASLPILPDVNVPALELDFEAAAASAAAPMIEPRLRPHMRRDSPRPTSLLGDRLSALSLRPDRSLRNMTHSLRRRRSPLRRDEDQADMLSRLLSVAAAATAASLMGNSQRVSTDARDGSIEGEDGTFDSFLQALQNGRIASALRNSGAEGGAEGGMSGDNGAPLNFFRMFRFGSPGEDRTSTDDDSRRDGNDGNEDGDGRLIPIIIVGIRSITPGSGTGQDDMIPPFIDALSNFPTTLSAGTSEQTIDGVLRQPRNGTRFSHRRRASLGGMSPFPSSYDNQRHHRTQDQIRPWSTISEASSGPRPPPTTPASPGLSGVPSPSQTPLSGPSLSSSAVPSRAPSRRASSIHRAPTPSPFSTLPTSTPTMDDGPRRSRSPPTFHIGPPDPPPTTSNTRTRAFPRHRRMSESEFNRSRRHGVVEPDLPETGTGNVGSGGPGDSARSWIIYVLGGSYPENHPILSTPSLFTDNPTYEDMMLLSALLGPAKPPVASPQDVEQAPGLYKIVFAAPTGMTHICDDNDDLPFVPSSAHSQRPINLEELVFRPAPLNIRKDISTKKTLMAVCQDPPSSPSLDPEREDATDHPQRILIGPDQRCLVCLFEFEVEETARRLMKCGHLFHRECIDQWLTTGRNSCPLCRGQGVDEKTAPGGTGSGATDEDAPSTTTATRATGVGSGASSPATVTPEFA